MGLDLLDCWARLSAVGAFVGASVGAFVGGVGARVGDLLRLSLNLLRLSLWKCFISWCTLGAASQVNNKYF